MKEVECIQTAHRNGKLVIYKKQRMRQKDNFLGVKMMTFDRGEEHHKILQHWGRSYGGDQETLSKPE